MSTLRDIAEVVQQAQVAQMHSSMITPKFDINEVKKIIRNIILIIAKEEGLNPEQVSDLDDDTRLSERVENEFIGLKRYLKTTAPDLFTNIIT